MIRRKKVRQKLIKLIDASDSEVFLDMTRKLTPIYYRKVNRVTDVLARFILFLFTGKR